MSKKHENSFGGVFPDEETLGKIYLKCLESMPQAPDAVRHYRNEMEDALENYICAVEEWVFRHAYQCGWEAAKKGGAEV